MLGQALSMSHVQVRASLQYYLKSIIHDLHDMSTKHCCNNLLLTDDMFVIRSSKCGKPKFLHLYAHWSTKLSHNASHRVHATPWPDSTMFTLLSSNLMQRTSKFLHHIIPSCTALKTWAQSIAIILRFYNFLRNDINFCFKEFKVWEAKLRQFFARWRTKVSHNRSCRVHATFSTRLQSVKPIISSSGAKKF